MTDIKPQVLQVLSRTQRLIVEPTRSVRVISAGPVGPAGLPGTAAGGHAASGDVSSPLLVWTMPHQLGFKPAGWMFLDQDGNEMEPVSVSDITTMVALATWLTPVSGTWLAS